VGRPARRGWGLLFTAGLLLLVGTNVQAGWLFALASLLLGVIVAGLAMPKGMIRGVHVERRAPAEAFAGQDVTVDILVRNTSRRTKLSLVVQDEYISPATAFVPTLGPGATAVASVRREAARRGVVDAGDLLLWSDAPFGIAVATRTIAAPGLTVVYPRVVSVSWLPDLASAAKPLQEALMRSRKGAGHDFLGIREYRAGDALRHVHWPSSAHHGDLMVREFEQELPRRLGILVDTWADTGRTGNESALDVCCSIAASIALFATRAGHPLALAAGVDSAEPEGSAGESNGTRGAVDVRTSAERTEALTWLAGLEAPAGPPFPVAIETAIPDLGRLDTLVLAFPTWRPNSAEGLAKMVSTLEGGGVHVIAALVEADSFEPGERAAPMLDSNAVHRLTAALANAGASVFRIRAGDDLAACLERAATS
jgi:hypothetical protein